MENKKYNIGLDIGTTSVGWAVVESNTQKLIKKNGKALWGVRLFEEASTAVDRRNFRSTRRRYDRRRERIRLLQEEFSQEINKIDNNFFNKLAESKYHKLDVNNKTIKISNNEKILIKKYNDKYKTIYHLRKKLINDNSQEDIRLVYLAMHHMIKYRGNFLYDKESFNVNDLSIEEKLIAIFEAFINYCPTLNIPDNYKEIIDINKIANILLFSSKNDLKVEIKNELINLTNNTFIIELIKLFIGNKFSLKKLFMLEDIENDLSISLIGSDFDDKYSEIEILLGDKLEVLTILKDLYDALFLKKLFKGSNNTSLSELMVEKYKQHEDDLNLLKNLFTNNRKLYNKLLRSEKDLCLYEKYIKNNISKENFYKELNKLLELLFKENTKIEERYLNQYNAIIQYRIANSEFLPRVTDSENGKYPYQLNKVELIKIIENQGKYYPFLLDKTEDNVYKIVKLLEFRIPYYVGPLVSENQSNYAWMERKILNEKITPYRFDKIVDKEKTAEKFIKRMISKCTYLFNEYALPSNSILYSKFKVMNELKQIKVNSQKLTILQQHRIFDELFLTTEGTITNKKFITFLHTLEEFNMFDEINVTGYSSDNKFANTMQVYLDFFGKNGLFHNTNYTEEDANIIIEWITIFDDKEILKDKIHREYKEIDLDIILKKKYKGWGELSEKLLTTKYYKDKKTEEYKSIMDLMYDTTENFMQILNNDKYKFQKMIKENNNIEKINILDYKLVNALATSPSTKKGIYQSLKIVNELVKYMGV